GLPASPKGGRVGVAVGRGVAVGLGVAVWSGVQVGEGVGVEASSLGVQAVNSASITISIVVNTH
ncbi:MAG TPA: hypothetical protein PK524_07445, partial [Brevefilum fermentans]|nr:hypothetical protein [Brevefilum fermentans]